MATTALFNDIFAYHAASKPGYAAVEFRDQVLSYREVADRSARLAAELSRRGVSRGTIVGVCVRPSLELPVAILGILLAGGAWLPLDPGYPADRLRYMIADSGLRLLLTDAGSVPGPTGADVEVLDLTRVAVPSGESAPSGDAASAARPGDLAYVIYTSGSTGRPKGVAVTREGLANLARALAEAFGVSHGDRVLQFAPTSFDASVFEMVMALSAGATLVQAAREDIPPGPELAGFLRARRITHLTLPPSVLATLGNADLPDLRVLVCAGEALPVRLAGQWQGGRRMFNAYGPTEATVWATLAELGPGGGKPSIGTAIHGVRTLVVDDRLREVPAGTPGELAIGGRGVARGYLGRPALTAERFVPYPGPGAPGERMYLTGDRVVRRPDGDLEFLGRIDHQVKIRGFRIEPDEIAARLTEYPGVAEAAVIARDTAAGGELTGYVTGSGLDIGKLREHLAARLPGYMMPGALVLLDSMPLTPSGKIDRAALPAPERGTRHPHEGAVTPTQRALIGILAPLLGTGRVGPEDDFFALGGHSLVAGQLAARVRAELGRELPLRKIYEARTVAAIARAIDSAEGGVRVPSAGARRGGPGPAPLSFPQQRIWFLEQLTPGNLAYNAQASLRLHGPLDPAALRRALTEIVRRHEVLRSSFRQIDESPVQIPAPPTEIQLPVADLTSFPEAERARLGEQVIAESLRRPFSLAEPPLARWFLVRYSATDHALIHVEHHLVHDGWSFAIFLRELRALYTAFAAGLPSPLPEPEVQYADFAVWQRGWLRGEVLDRFVSAWKTELAGIPPALELMTDRPRPAIQSFAGDAIRIDLPAALSKRLRDYSGSRGITLYATMLTVFGLLMSRHSGQRDIVVGSGVANRRLAEFENMIGMVVNTLPLRVSLSGRPTFDELARGVHTMVATAHEWQDVPLDRLVEALAPVRDPSRNPLFQVMFSFHDSHIPDHEFGGLRAEVLELHNGSAKTDLNVVVVPHAEQHAGHAVDGDATAITLIWEYATDLFDRSTMRALVGRYLTLAGAAVASPATACERLPLLTDDETREVLAGSFGKITPFPSRDTIPSLFARQAAATPTAVAVVCGERTHSYAELDGRATRLARLLRARGVADGVPVGVLLERGDSMVIAILAVLKAGGAYVPLDPGYPPQRLSWMLGDVRTPVVVTRRDLIGRIDTSALGVVLLDDEEEPPVGPPLPAVSPNALAYVLFTSGSTGRPKGVMVEHRSVLRLVCGTDYMEFGPGERIGQVADASFDAFTFEIWGALLHGGTLCVIPTETLLTRGGLRRALREHKVTSMFLTSVLYSEVMADHPDTFAGMTNLLVGGDALNVTSIRRLLEGDPAHRPTRLVNGYGPTETTTFAVCGLIADLPPDAISVPIGRPIANTSGYVLDDYLQPVPAGMAGELFIGGPGVARGYANRPGLTADRFIPDPFAADGSRMYRTGDTVRYLRSGAIEFIGRADDQVKIRGFRIEPGEVEAALTTHPGVARAAVVVDEAPSGRRLVGYLVPAAPGASPSSAELYEFLSARLPSYMVPGAFAALPSLPLTISGKVDRAALLATHSELSASEAVVAPRNDTERTLATLVAELLGVTEVGITDDFFALGGHSLLAMRLVARSNGLFSVDVALGEFLASPTVARFALAVDAARACLATAEPAARGQDRTAASDERLLERLPELSDDEVEALLRSMSDDETER